MLNISTEKYLKLQRYDKRGNALFSRKYLKKDEKFLTESSKERIRKLKF